MSSSPTRASGSPFGSSGLGTSTATSAPMTSRFSCRPSSLPVMLSSFVAKKSFRMSALVPWPKARSSAVAGNFFFLSMWT